MADDESLYSAVDPKEARRRRRSFFDESKKEYSNLMKSLNERLAAITQPGGTDDLAQPRRQQPTAERVLPALDDARLTTSDAVSVEADVCVVSFDALLVQGATATLDGLLNRGVDIVIPYSVLNLVDDSAKTASLPDRNLTAPIPSHELRTLLRDPTTTPEERSALKRMDWQHSVDRGNAALVPQVLKSVRDWFLRMLVESDKSQTGPAEALLPEWVRPRRRGALRIQKRTETVEGPPDATGAPSCWCCVRGDKVVPDRRCPARSPSAPTATCVAGTIVAAAKFEAFERQSQSASDAAPMRQRRVAVATHDVLTATLLTGTAIQACPLHAVLPPPRAPTG